MAKLLAPLNPALKPKSEDAEKAQQAYNAFLEKINFQESLGTYGFGLDDADTIADMAYDNLILGNWIKGSPIKIDKKACLNFKLNRTATSEPVQAPVTGRGMATNNAKPIRSYFSTILPRRLACSKSQCKNRSKNPILLRYLEMTPRNSRIIGTGSRLPMIDRGRA